MQIVPLAMSKIHSMVETTNITSSWVTAELRSDHAGETGAIWIYRGILATTQEQSVREFAQHHLRTEQQHLALIEKFLHKENRSYLLPLWRLAGFLTGALPSIISSQAVFATISAVETFVVLHYQAQINRLQTQSSWADLCKVLQSCCDDEAKHESEAAFLLGEKPGFLLRNWCRLVSLGSALAVKLARIL